LARNVTVHPFDRLGGGEGQRAREHLVERHTDGVKIAAAVDRAVHASRLLGSHVGERASNRLGRVGRLPLAWQSRGNPEARQPRLACRGVDQDVRGFDVLVNDASAVRLAQSRRKTGGEPQEEAQLHRRFRGRMPTERAADRRFGEESRQ
jgi:hypothetical protein